MSDPLDQITPLLITYNEEANIGRTLESLRWARRILVIDSGSTDRTLELIAALPQVEVVQRGFDSFARQCNFGLRLIHTPWCLSLDADHRITPAFQAELEVLIPTIPAEVAAIRCPFRYLVAARPLRGTLLPPRLSLIRPDGGQYVDDGHAHQFVPRGPIQAMHEAILHDDRKPLSRWLTSQQRYLHQEAIKLRSTPSRLLSFQDRFRKQKVIAPFAVLFLCLIWHRGIFDGWRGWFYAFQRMYAELLLSLMLWEAEQQSN